MERYGKNGDGSRLEELKENLRRKEAGNESGGRGRGRIGVRLCKCKEKRLRLKFGERLKGTDSWLEDESWVSAITEYG